MLDLQDQQKTTQSGKKLIQFRFNFTRAIFCREISVGTFTDTSNVKTFSVLVPLLILFSLFLVYGWVETKRVFVCRVIHDWHCHTIAKYFLPFFLYCRGYFTFFFILSSPSFFLSRVFFQLSLPLSNQRVLPALGLIVTKLRKTHGNQQKNIYFQTDLLWKVSKKKIIWIYLVRPRKESLTLWSLKAKNLTWF